MINMVCAVDLCVCLCCVLCAVLCQENGQKIFKSCSFFRKNQKKQHNFIIFQDSNLVVTVLCSCSYTYSWTCLFICLKCQLIYVPINVVMHLNELFTLKFGHWETSYQLKELYRIQRCERVVWSCHRRKLLLQRIMHHAHYYITNTKKRQK